MTRRPTSCRRAAVSARTGGLALLIACLSIDAHAQESAVREARDPASAARPDSIALWEGLGEHHHPIGTRSALAQRYFDQGLRLIYGFNHADAIRSFRVAQRLDPSCAMCYWGEALALGPNINVPMDSASGAAAYLAVRRAMAL